MQKDVYLPCTIRRSPFSGERFVQSKVEGLNYRGAVSTRYCLTGEKKPLGDLSGSESVDGYLRVLLSSKTAREATLSMPDGTFVKVSPDVIASLR